MGIAGHMLGERKLRRLVAWSGIPFDRAFNRNGEGVARLVVDGRCVHFFVDYRAQTVERITSPTHWSSCRDPA